MKAAVSRLDFGPKPREMEVTEIATGHFVFRPVEGKEVSFDALDEAVVNAGYEIEDAALTVTGTVTDARHLETPSGQRFHVTRSEGEGASPFAELEPGAEVTVRGGWRSGEGLDVIAATEVRPASPAEEDLDSP